MVKKELEKLVAEKTGLKGTKAKELTEAVIESIKESLIAGNNLYIRKFATFRVVERKARKARNLQSGTTINIPAYKRIVLKLSPEFEEKLK